MATTSTEIKLDVSFVEGSSSRFAMGEVVLFVTRVHVNWGRFEEITHEFRRRRPSTFLLVPENARSVVSSMIADVQHPRTEDVVLWTDSISEFVYNAALAADRAGWGTSFVVFANIAIFDRRPLRGMFEQVSDVAPVPRRQPFGGTEQEIVDQVMLLSADEAGGVSPARPLSLVTELESLTYEGGDESGTTTTTICVICMDDFEQGSKLSKTPCCHVFHEHCLARWLEKSHTCPVCRFSLSAETARPRIPV